MDASPITGWAPQPWFLVSAPRTNALARRPRIEATLDDLSCHHPIVLVTAPSGYAKSSSLASWVQHSSGPKAWLTLTPSNAGSDEQFLHGLISALHRIAPDADVRDSLVLGALFPDASGTQATVARIAEMAMSLTRPLVVVIDDAHQAGPALAEGPLSILAEHCGGMLRFVVAGTMGLATWFNRSLVSGVAGRMGSAELALSTLELRPRLPRDPSLRRPNSRPRRRSMPIPMAGTLRSRRSRWVPGDASLPNPQEAGEMLIEYVASSVLGKLRPELPSSSLPPPPVNTWTASWPRLADR